MINLHTKSTITARGKYIIKSVLHLSLDYIFSIFMNICTVQARNVEYVDPQDKEWEEFQKMIQEETKVSC